MFISGIFLHDPVSFVAVVRPDLFTYKKGVVRVETQGFCVGHTLMDQGLKKYEYIRFFLNKIVLFLIVSFNGFSFCYSWNSSNPWTGYSPVDVAWTVNVDGVLDYIKDRLMAS